MQRTHRALVGLAGALLLASPAWAKPKPRTRPGVPDRKFQKEIDAAVERGAEWLRAQQKSSGQLAFVKHGGAVHYEIGGTALGGLALLAAGDKPDPKLLEQGDGAVDRAMRYCRAKDKERAGVRTTYDTGTLLMFATKYYGTTKPPKKRRGSVGEEQRRNPCAMPPDVREWVRSMAESLMETQKDTGGWGYPAGEEDFSNTQYALLGLRAAKDCGIPIRPGVWLRAIERTLALQEADGPKVKRIIPPDRPGGTRYVVDSNDRARGWGYKQGVNVITGSMTTAAIAILLVAHDGLTNPRKFPGYRPSKQIEVAQAAQDGYAWLNVNFDVTRNPGRNAPAWHYYYLYGLERACALGGRDLLGDHDWYLTGARYLVDAQKEDGRWRTGLLGVAVLTASDVLDTAWAILFLQRATHPIKPVPAPAITR